MSTYRLRYTDDAYDGQFRSIRYPSANRPGYPTRERAEQVLAAMPDPDRMQIEECD